MDSGKWNCPLYTVHSTADTGSTFRIFHRHCNAARCFCRSIDRENGGRPMTVLILCLFLATIITRILPAFFVTRLTLPEWLVTYLNYIPYAALGVLIFPGILSAVERPVYGLLGAVFATVLALLRVPLFFIVLGSIVFVYLITL